VGEAAPPVDPKQLKGRSRPQAVRPDFLNWAIDVPNPDTPSSPPRPPSRRAGHEQAAVGRFARAARAGNRPTGLRVRPAAAARTRSDSSAEPAPPGLGLT